MKTSLWKTRPKNNVKITLSLPCTSHNQKVEALHLLYEASITSMACFCFFPCVTSPWLLPSWRWVSIQGCLSHHLVASSICAGICCPPRSLHRHHLPDINWLISPSSGYPEHTCKREINAGQPRRCLLRLWYADISSAPDAAFTSCVLSVNFNRVFLVDAASTWLLSGIMC